MPREYCRVCEKFQTMTSADINHRGRFECPGCGTWLGKAKKTKHRRG